MNDLIKIAFRNMFRNFRRSLLTIFISFLSVTFLVFSSSFLGGMFNNLLNESIKFTGHVRLNSKNYDIQERMMSLTGNVTGYSALKQKILKTHGVQQVAGRLKFAGLVYKGDENKEAFGCGIEAADLQILDFKNLTYQGRPIDTNAKNEIIAGRQLAESLNLSTGDQVTVLTRTLYNSAWASNFKVVGIFDLQNGKLNKGFYISLSGAQELLDMADRVLEVSVFGASNAVTPDLIKNLRNIPEVRELELKQWNQIGLAPSLTGIITVVSTIIQLIIITLAGLGIANTMMMAVFERKNEIGLLKSMGMHESEITTLFSLEGIFLGLIGTIFGLLIGGTGAYFLHTHGLNVGGQLQGLPIVIGNMIYGTFDNFIFLKGIILGLGAAILASLLPALNGVRRSGSQ
jgi:putative ABC transport system permease protein